MAPNVSTYRTPSGPTWNVSSTGGYVAPAWAYADSGPLGAARRVREQERNRYGMASTILTSGLGDTSPVPVQRRSLLGS